MREWVMQTAFSAFTFMVPICGVALGITVFVLVPLGLWRRTRAAGATGLLVASFIFGLTTWLLGAALTFGLFGWFGLIIGLLFAGLGVVPLGIIGAIFKTPGWGLPLLILGWLILTVASRGGAYYFAAKTDS